MAQLRTPPVRFGGLQDYVESQDPMMAALRARQQQVQQPPMMMQQQRPPVHEGSMGDGWGFGQNDGTAPLYFGGKPWKPSTWNLNRRALPSWMGGNPYDMTGMEPDPMGFSAFSGGGSRRGSDMMTRAALAGLVGGAENDDDYHSDYSSEPEADNVWF